MVSKTVKHGRHGDDFEKALRDLMLQVQQEATERGLRLSFSTGRSLEEELNKSTNTDAKIVVISYIVMFLYASLSLGSTFSFSRNSLVTSKFTLGLFRNNHRSPLRRVVSGNILCIRCQNNIDHSRSNTLLRSCSRSR